MHIPYKVLFPCRSPSNEHEDDLDLQEGFDFERSVNTDELEENDAEDQVLPSDLARLIEHEEKQILPHLEATELIDLGNEEEKRELRIGTTLAPEEKQQLVDLLREYIDVFAWSYQDMPGLNTDIVVHRLPIKEEFKPVQQKLRRMRPEMLLKIREEVKKQFEA